MTVTDKVLTFNSSYLCITPIEGYKIPTPIYVNTEYIGLILSNFHSQENATFPVKLPIEESEARTDYNFPSI